MPPGNPSRAASAFESDRMTDTTRPQGYLTEVGYPAFFHPEQAPSWLAAVLAALGRPAPQSGTWCEIGCGQGFAATLLAAANPAMRFTGIDINPRHIDTARRRAEAAGLENVDFLCADIRDAGAAGGSFGHILSHGVLSWVSDGVREAIADFAAARLAPGGIAVLHYMSEPGGSAFRSFHSVFRQLAGSRDPVAEGAAILRAMRDAGAGFFQLHAHAGPSLDTMETEDPAYIAHEYMNADFHPLAFREVQGLMAARGLDWLGSAVPVDNIDAVSVPEKALAAIAPVEDPVLRETLKDLARNQALRYDIFVQPGAAPDAAGHMDLLRAARWGLLPAAPRPPFAADLSFSAKIGAVRGDRHIFGPLLERLGQGPARFGDFAQIPPFAGRPGLLNQALQTALWAGLAHPVQPVADPARAGRLNRLLLQEAALGGKVPALAAPALGAGLAVSADQIAALAAGQGGVLRLMFALDA